MDKKIKDKLSIYGLEPSDLTKKELDALKEEIKTEEKGGFVLDGVLSSPDVQLRAFKRPSHLK